jgi:hypothetical protein
VYSIYYDIVSRIGFCVDLSNLYVVSTPFFLSQFIEGLVAEIKVAVPLYLFLPNLVKSYPTNGSVSRLLNFFLKSSSPESFPTFNLS